MLFSFIKKNTLHLVVFKQTNKRSRKPKGQSRDTDNVEHRTKKITLSTKQPGVNSNAREEAFLIVQIKGIFFKKRFI
jgi:hypothetical protein